jgi:hypothetical protein
MEAQVSVGGSASGTGWDAERPASHTQHPNRPTSRPPIRGTSDGTLYRRLSSCDSNEEVGKPGGPSEVSEVRRPGDSRVHETPQPRGHLNPGMGWRLRGASHVSRTEAHLLHRHGSVADLSGSSLGRGAQSERLERS